MKKHFIEIISILLLCCMAFSFTACGNDNDNNSSNSSNGQGDNSNNHSSDKKVKLLGDIIPEPSMSYDIINGSDESVYLEVENATESDFRAYVESCEPYGFEGYIQSATVPDLYFREYNAENYFLEIRFNEDEQNFSVYISTPSK